MSIVEYEGMGAARKGLQSILDSAEAGMPVRVRRHQNRVAVVDADRLRHLLTSLGSRAEIVSEDGAWSLFFPGLPIAAEGDSVEEAVDDAVLALREYAEDWVDRLHVAPNHTDNWGLVQLVSLSTDQQLRDWLLGFAA
jgi:predicted RNase H-like HicB family nuclease